MTLLRERDPLRRARVVDYFTKQHLTMREIGRLEGISAPAVCKMLQRHGISASAGTWVQLTCPICHQSFRRERGRYKRTRVPTCSLTCYRRRRAAQTIPSSFYWRQGMRIARQAVRRAGFPLTRTHVVHHVDGDHRNNALPNLWVFKDASAHQRFHHGGRHIAPVWMGAGQ